MRVARPPLAISSTLGARADRECTGVDVRALRIRHTGGRPSDAGEFDISMENAQEGVWLLAISLPHPRQTLPTICVQWPSRARDARLRKSPGAGAVARICQTAGPGNPGHVQVTVSSIIENT